MSSTYKFAWTATNGSNMEFELISRLGAVYRGAISMDNVAIKGRNISTLINFYTSKPGVRGMSLIEYNVRKLINRTVNHVANEMDRLCSMCFKN